MRKCILILSLAKLRQNAEVIFKNFELFIYGDKHYTVEFLITDTAGEFQFCPL